MSKLGKPGSGPQRMRQGWRWVLCWVFCVSAAHSAAAQNDWKDAWAGDWQPARSEHGVEVKTALLPGSRFLAFRAETVVAAPLEQTLLRLIDHERYPEWYYQCRSVELLEMGENDSALVHITIDSPFPLADRDAVNFVTVERYPDEVWVRLLSQPERLPQTKKAVRMRVANGAWHLQAEAEGTRVIHYYQADPEARAPAWMVNRFVVDGPIHSLSELRADLELAE